MTSLNMSSKPIHFKYEKFHTHGVIGGLATFHIVMNSVIFPHPSLALLEKKMAT
jgi:hypothetical protein